MKRRTQMIAVGAILLGVTALSVMKRGANPGRVPNTAACCSFMVVLDTEPVTVSTNQITTNAMAQQVIAYYFHGAVRCETCLKIEQQARGLMEQQFSAELAANRLMFTPVNYELPENAHFLTDYKLPCPSLVLVRRKAGRDRQWKLLSDTWQLVEDPVKFNGYVETEVRNFLDGQERDSTPNQFKLPPAQGDR